MGGYDAIGNVRRNMQKVSEDVGITAFIDKRGRSWNMASYTDMLCRTSSMQIFHQAKTNEYLAHGEDLVIVTSHTPTCAKCAPWNGKILSLTGETPGYPTMEEAKAAGLFHPNCRHTYGLYVEDDGAQGLEGGSATEPERNTTTSKQAGIEEPVFSEAESIEAANSFAKDVLGLDADYTGIDLRNANEWNRGLFEMRREFPEVFKNIKLVGSCQYRIETERDVYYQIMYDDYIKIGKTEEQAKVLAEADKKKYRLRVPKNVWAQSAFRKGAWAKTNGITLNKHTMSKDTYETLQSELKRGVESKFHPIGGDTLKSIFDHEFGHQMDGYLDLSQDNVIMKEWKNQTKEEKEKNLSRYACKNVEEFIAEAWSEYRNNPDCRSLAKKIGQRAEELYKAKRGT